MNESNSPTSIAAEIDGLSPVLARLQEAEAEAGAPERAALRDQVRATEARLMFLSVALSYQTPRSLEDALAQAVRLYCELNELIGYIPQEDMREANPIAECATRLTYALIFALEQATGRPREQFGWNWSGAATEDDPFAALRRAAQ